MPREITQPIHTAIVGLGNLRFFRSPLEGPRQPWHAVSDLFTCLAMDRGLRRAFHYRIKHEWKKDVRNVWTDTGETLIAPHFMAQGLIDSMIEIGRAPAGSDAAYAMACVGAMKAITAGMDAAASVNYTIAAYRNENGIEGDFEPVKLHPGGIIR